MKNKEYEPQNDLIDKSEPFMNGFECGIVWKKLQEGGRLWKYMFNTENSAQIQMFCDYLNIECKIEFLSFDYKWSMLTTHGQTEDPANFLNP